MRPLAQQQADPKCMQRAGCACPMAACHLHALLEIAVPGGQGVAGSPHTTSRPANARERTFLRRARPRLHAAVCCAPMVIGQPVACDGHSNSSASYLQCSLPAVKLQAVICRAAGARCCATLSVSTQLQPAPSGWASSRTALSLTAMQPTGACGGQVRTDVHDRRDEDEERDERRPPVVLMRAHVVQLYA